MAPGGDAPLVARALRPVRTFDRACELVLRYLTAAAPMGLWAVTRVVGGRQVFLRIVTDDEGVRSGYGAVPTGTEIDFADTLCRSMVTGATPQIAPDVTRVPEYAPVAAASPLPLGAYVGIPIVRPGGELFGTVCGYSPRPRPAALSEHQPLLALLSNLLSSVLEADAATTAMERELERARQEADTDVLTGLLNRRGWERLLQREEERYHRFGDPACVLVLDLDQLKAVNDAHGHDAGDRHIRRAADALSAVVRSGDLLARLGGDEFGVVAHGVGPEQAGELVDRMEQALDAAGVAGTFGHAPYTVVTGFPGAWKLADEAMYVRKQARRSGIRR
jgi:diguanylate cyclase (GGDEF)-like protein